MIFANFNLWLMVVVTAVMLWLMPRWTKRIITKRDATRVSEPEVKFIILALFFLGGMAHSDRSELWGRLRDDTADRVSDHAHCSVLIVK